MKEKESDDYLYHFTREYNSLLSILTDKFKPFYCTEDLSYIYGKDRNLTMAFPITCFCDIPIERQGVHREKYGNYGIGLKKDWGMNNNLSIVNYTYKESLASSCLRILIDEYTNSQTSFAIRNALSILIMTFKPYEGGVSIRNRFYDEKEWRYIPINVDNLYLSIALDDFGGNKEDFKKKIEAENIRIQENNRLNFSVDDISHVFLREENEKEQLINDISKIYSKIEVEKIKQIIVI